MTISIAPTDFGDDIIDMVSPIMKTLGVMDEDGEIDISGWSFDKILELFNTYERTESLIDIISSVTGLPEVYFRELETTNSSQTKESGLLYSTNGGNPSQFDREEWFRVYPSLESPEKWGIHITVSHTKGALIPGTSTHDHTLRLGLGVSMDIGIGSENLQMDFSLPILEVSSTAGASNLELLLWKDESGLSNASKSRCRPSVSLRLSRSGSARYETPSSTYPSCEAIGLKATVGNGGVNVNLIFEDYMTSSSSIGSDFVIDTWGSAGGLLSNILDGIIPTILDKLGDGIRINEDLLPMIGLLDSVDFGNDTGCEWPRLDLLEIFSHIDNPQQMWQTVMDWFDEMTTELIPGNTNSNPIIYWLGHLYRLVQGGTTLPTIDGGGTKADPWRLAINLVGADVKLNVLIANYTDESSIQRFDIGIQAEVVYNSGIKIRGGIDCWVVSIPLSQGNSPSFLPDLSALFTIQHPTWSSASPTKLVDLAAASPPTGGNPLDSLILKFERGKIGLRMNSDHDLIPVVELLEVDVGTTHWEILDLTDSNLGDDILSALTGTLMDIVSEYFTDGAILQWLGSLLGLCSPRDDILRNPLFPPIPGDFSYQWYGVGGGTDLRLDFAEVISDPLCGLIKYYEALLLPSNTIRVDGVDQPAWVFVFEALGNLLGTLINGSDGFEPPGHLDPPLGNSSPSTVLASPWKYTLTPDGDMPAFSLTSSYDHVTKQFNFGVELLLSMVKIAEQVQFTAKISAELLEFVLPAPGTCTLNDLQLLPNVSAAVGVRNELGGSGARMEIDPIAGIHASIEAIEATAIWGPNIGFSWDISLVKPGVYVVYPDWNSLFADIDTPGGITWPDLDLFSWDGLNLRLPSGEIHPFSVPSAFPFNVSIPGLSFDIPMTGFSLGWPWFDSSNPTLSGNWGFGKSGFNWPTIPGFALPSNPFSLPQIRSLIGRWLSFKLGNWGLFLSGFFKLNVDLPSLDLDMHLNSLGSDFSLPEFDLPDIDWPSGWTPSFNVGGGSGLGPFYLPLDWPELDWSLFFDDPWPTIKQFFIDLFSGSSRSGEPFAFPALRWIWGLITGSLPDLRLPDLGWGSGSGGGLSIPDVPINISGDGSYDNPWSIPLSSLGLKRVELLFWLDPDGLPDNGLIDLVLNVVPNDIVEMVSGGLAIDSTVVANTYPTDWADKISSLLSSMSKVSPKISKALGGMNVDELKAGLLLFEEYLQSSDGLVTVDNQLCTDSGWVNPSSPFIGTHWNALESTAIMADLQTFLNSNVGVPLFIQAPWNEPTSWDSILTSLSLSSPNNFDLSAANTPTVDINTIDLSAIDASTCYTLKIATNTPTGMTDEQFFASQVSLCVNHIQSLGSTPVAIIGHSVGGLAGKHYSNGAHGSTASTSVVGLYTICTPHSGFKLDDYNETLLRKISHILELIGFGGRASNNSTPDPPSGSGITANRTDIEETISMITQNREGPTGGGF